MMYIFLRALEQLAIMGPLDKSRMYWWRGRHCNTRDYWSVEDIDDKFAEEREDLVKLFGHIWRKVMPSVSMASGRCDLRGTE